MFCDHNLFIDKNTNTMKQKIRLTESQLHNIIRKCVNEVAVQGRAARRTAYTETMLVTGLDLHLQGGINHKTTKPTLIIGKETVM